MSFTASKNLRFVIFTNDTVKPNSNNNKYPIVFVHACMHLCVCVRACVRTCVCDENHPFFKCAPATSPNQHWRDVITADLKMLDMLLKDVYDLTKN